MKINEVEQQIGVSKKNIRFYEDQGLLHPARNMNNSYREYSEEDVELLRRIKLLRKLDVPIEEIRRVINGSLSLNDCLDRHGILLDHRKHDLELIRNICSDIRNEGMTFSGLQTTEILRKIEEMEKEGVHFVDVKKSDVRKKKRGALLSAAVMIALMAIVLFSILSAAAEDPIPKSVLLLVILLPSAVVIGVLLALRERMIEIDKGEEDEASNY